MNKYHKIVTCASYGGTGSSVITDLLKEFSNIKSLGNYEFSIAHDVDGISDLQHFLMEDFHRMKVDEGIYRFRRLVNTIGNLYNEFFKGKFVELSEEYLKELTDVTWNGYWQQHYFRLNRLDRYLVYTLPQKAQLMKHKLKPKNHGYEFVPYYKRSPMYFGYKPKDFISITKNYMEKLFHLLDEEYKYDYIAIDQLVPPNNTSRYLNYFNDLKIIVVDRDPRDLYLLNKLFWKEGWIPTEDVVIFSKWFRLMREPLKHEVDDPSKVLRVNFEDFIFNYEEQVNKIENFLGIDPSMHKEKKAYFNPEISIKNCRLWEKFSDYGQEVNYIKSSLKEFCYEL